MYLWLLYFHIEISLKIMYLKACIFFSLRHFSHFLLRVFSHLDIPLVCLSAALKLAVTVFTNLCFQTF